MTASATIVEVPMDLAPKVASADPSDHGVPTGREEEWRFAPLNDLRDLFEPVVGAATVRATSDSPLVTHAASPAHRWLPTDRVAAIARERAAEVVRVAVPDDASIAEPIQVSLATDAPIGYQHVEITAGRHSRSVVVIEADAQDDVAGAVSIEAGDGAELVVLVHVDLGADVRALHHIPVLVGRDAQVTVATLALGGRVVRLQPSVRYAGPGGRANVLGAFLVQGQSRLEQRVFVDHVEPHCTSRVTYKGALSGDGARSVWIGDVLVRHAAIGTDTYELNRNLLLDDGPRADSVPNLELETGEIVGAGHASATGRFDEEQLFYLQARGIPAPIARQLIVRGFFAEVLGALPDASMREQFDHRIIERLGLVGVLGD